MLPQKIIEIDVPDCIEPYNWAPVYIWSGFGALLMVLAAIVAITVVISNNKRDRRMEEIRNTHQCPNCLGNWVGKERR